jgi:hypothetical protein
MSEEFRPLAFVKVQLGYSNYVPTVANATAIAPRVLDPFTLSHLFSLMDHALHLAEAASARSGSEAG